MASAIDATKPVSGTPTTQSVRDNFATAKSEITALQAALPVPLTVALGGTNATTAAAALSSLGAVAKAGDTMTGTLIVNPGSLGVGTASPGSLLTVKAPTAVSDPVSVIADNGQRARILYTCPTVRTWAVGLDTMSGANRFSISDESAGATRLIIDTAGACTNTTGTWSAISDVRLKQDVGPYDRGLAAILALNPVTFVYTGEAGLPAGAPQFGLIAQEVEPIVPEVVGTQLLVGEAGLVEFKTVDPGQLIYSCINAIQELQAQIDALKAQLPVPPP